MPAITPIPSRENPLWAVQRRGRVLRLTLIAALFAHVITRWLLPIRSSLWLDETSTAWATQGSLTTVMEHCRELPFLIPLYMTVVWGARAIAGSSEIVLRLPSAFFMALAAVSLHRLAERLAGRRCALLAVLAFIANPWIVFYAIEARQYGLAVFAAAGAMCMLVEWLHGGRRRAALGFVLFAVLTVHTQYLFGIMLVVYAACAFVQVRNGARVSGRALAAAAFAIGVLLLPLAAQVRAMFAATPAISGVDYNRSLMDVLVSWRWLLALAAGFALAILCQPKRRFADRFSFPPMQRGMLAVIVLWALLPPLFLIAIHSLTNANVLIARYALGSVPAWALLAGWLLAGLCPAQQKAECGSSAEGVSSETRGSLNAAQLVAACLLVFALAGPTVSWFQHGPDDWRSASSALRLANAARPAPILVVSGFGESAGLDPTLPFLISPVITYPTGGRDIGLPVLADARGLRHLARYTSVLGQSDRFYLMGYDEPVVRYGLWLRERFSEDFAVIGERHFGTVRVVVFKRNRQPGKEAGATRATLAFP